jgi:uncharacterized pyridoxal phosphate-containing UPF0001 family protein
MSDIRQAIEAVRERIDRAWRIAGRDPAGVTLVAVTKTVDAARVVEAIEAVWGHRRKLRAGSEGEDRGDRPGGHGGT